MLQQVRMLLIVNVTTSEDVTYCYHFPDEDPYAPQGSTPLLPKLSVTSKVSAPTSHAWVGSLVHFRSSEDVTLLEFTSPIDCE